jgi:GDP-mannose 4,6 dehydratase
MLPGPLESPTVKSAFAGKRVLITGGLGFIGSNLARTLVELGARVTIVDCLAPEYGGHWRNLEGFKSRLTVNISDVRDVHSLPHFVREEDFNARNLLSRPPHRKRSERGRASGREGGLAGVWPPPTWRCG